MITEEQKDNMLHALGRPSIRLDWKPETILKKAYRNKFLTYKEDKNWEDLISKGFAKKIVQNNPLISKEEAMYYVTEEGVKYLQKQN